MVPSILRSRRVIGLREDGVGRGACWVDGLEVEVDMASDICETYQVCCVGFVSGPLRHLYLIHTSSIGHAIDDVPRRFQHSHARIMAIGCEANQLWAAFTFLETVRSSPLPTVWSSRILCFATIQSRNSHRRRFSYQVHPSSCRSVGSN